MYNIYTFVFKLYLNSAEKKATATHNYCGGGNRLIVIRQFIRCKQGDTLFQLLRLGSQNLSKTLVYLVAFFCI